MEEQVKKKVAFLWDAMWAVLLLAEHLMIIGGWKTHRENQRKSIR